EYDRNGGSCSFGCQRGRRGNRNDYGCRVSYQFGSQCRKSLKATIGRQIFDRDIAAFDIAELPEALPDRAELAIIEVGAGQQTDQRYGSLLRARRERPCCRAADQRDERAALHSITSSARPSRVIGKVM